MALLWLIYPQRKVIVQNMESTNSRIQNERYTRCKRDEKLSSNAFHCIVNYTLSWILVNAITSNLKIMFRFGFGNTNEMIYYYMRSTEYGIRNTNHKRQNQHLSTFSTWNNQKAYVSFQKLLLIIYFDNMINSYLISFQWLWPVTNSRQIEWIMNSNNISNFKMYIWMSPFQLLTTAAYQMHFTTNVQFKHETQFLPISYVWIRNWK